MSMTNPLTVAVLGAGLTGLTAAYQLRRGLGPGARIVVMDPATEIGGKLKTVDADNGALDIGAEAFLGFRKDAVDFFTDIGLADEFVLPSTLPSKLYANGQLVSMPRTTVMGVPVSSDGLDGLISEETAKRIDTEGDPALTPPLHWVPGDDCNLGQLVEARLGREVVDHVVSPLIGGVYSTLADDLGLRATVPQLAQALDELVLLGDPVSLTGAAQRVLDARKAAAQPRVGSEAATSGDEAKPAKPMPVFKTFRGGYRVVYNRLLELAAPELKLGVMPSAIAADGRGYRIRTDEAAVADSLYVDAVVVAAPAPQTGTLLTDVAPDAAELIGAIDLANSAVVAMRFDTDEGLPQINGILVAADADLSAKAFTLSSRKWPHIGERGGAVVRASFGRFGDDSTVRLRDDELVAKAQQDLATTTGFAVEPVEVIVQRWWGGLPRYGKGHPEFMRFVDDALAETPRLAVAGAWHHGPGIPACIADAKDAAAKVIREVA
ncbi:protoporphyrinogen oxidase [Corynebacterium sp. H113]|uniref:protoporphyrinogen oxidase n=1 Tax=Corynebacterium sp. H113 TaxID=3133419 RepID=UPI00309AAF37